MTWKQFEEEFNSRFVDRVSGDMWQTTSREEILNFIKSHLSSLMDEMTGEYKEEGAGWAIGFNKKVGEIKNFKQNYFNE